MPDLLLKAYDILCSKKSKLEALLNERVANICTKNLLLLAGKLAIFLMLLLTFFLKFLKQFMALMKSFLFFSSAFISSISGVM